MRDDKPGSQAIRRVSSEQEYFFEEGCYILELHNSTDDDELSIAQARVPVGGRTRRHRLTSITERYFILQGQGQVEIGTEEPAEVRAGDVVVIQPDIDQCISNTGSEDLVFLALCTPRFMRDAYLDTQDDEA